MPNNVMVIVVRTLGEGRPVWVFDDPAKGLETEPFVGESSDAITSIAISQGWSLQRPISIVFSAEPLPDTMMQLDRIDTKEENEGVGHTYRWERGALDCWLCPALFKYFDRAPKTIYARFSQRKTKKNRSLPLYPKF